MRALNTADLMKAVTIAGKISHKIKDQLNTEESEKLSSLQIGMAVIGAAMQYAETEFTELLASIAEMNIEEFKKQPFDYPIQVIEELAEKEDLADFLQRVTSLRKRLSKR